MALEATFEKTREMLAHEEEEKSKSLYASLIIVLMVGLVGFPVWWMTTNVYRAHLPYDDIDALFSSPIDHTIPVDVILFYDNNDTKEFLINQLDSHFQAQDVESSLVFHIDYRVELARDEQINTLNHISEFNSSQEFAAKMTSDVDPSRPHYTFLIVEDERYQSVEHFSHGRYIWLSDPGDNFELINILWKAIEEIYSDELLTDTYEKSKSRERSKSDLESMVAVTSTTDFEIVFTLLNPDPIHWDVSWNIKEAIDGYMKPMLDRLSDVAEFRLSSQVMFYVNIPQVPRYNPATHDYYYGYEALSYLINPIESKLGSSVFSSHSLNFIVYLPLKANYPLYMENVTGKPIKSNSFLSPRWGGVMFYNPPVVPQGGHGDPLTQQVDVDMRDLIPVFGQQLKELLGVPCGGVCDGVLNDMDVDNFLRIRTLDNVATAMATLQSLARLLNEQKNMVISDSISERVLAGVEAVAECKQALADGHLGRAARASKLAIENAEKAFFDPAILERLYFPEDQKFAIYVPMFLPLSLPVVLSIRDVVQWLKRSVRHR